MRVILENTALLRLFGQEQSRAHVLNGSDLFRSPEDALGEAPHNIVDVVDGELFHFSSIDLWTGVESVLFQYVCDEGVSTFAARHGVPGHFTKNDPIRVTSVRVQ